MPRTIKELAQEAINVQDACNLSGVVNGFARSIADLREHVKGSDALASHPISRLWADKIASLTGTQSIGHDAVMRAYTDCHELINPPIDQNVLDALATNGQ
jgi:hypothetical protein